MRFASLLLVLAIAGGSAGAESPAVSLASLWQLAKDNNPSLHEAAADVEAARGQAIQAGKYPNPRFSYEQEDLGTRNGPPGTIRFVLTQDLVTSGKRRLDAELGARGTDVALLGLLGRQFEVLTQVRRSYHDYLAVAAGARVSDDVVGVLEENLAITRKLVEGQIKPRTDLLRLQILLEEAKTNQERSGFNVDAAWRQLAADIGVPTMAPPGKPGQLPEEPPIWNPEEVRRRVLAGHTDVRQAQLESERRRVEIDRARAEACPNVQVGGGYSRNFSEKDQGAVLSLQTDFPLWDRKQGRVRAAEAMLSRAQAAERTAANRLLRETAEALARYEGARCQVDRLRKVILPQLQENLALVRQGYQAGAANFAFTDVQLAVEAQNDARLRLVGAQRELWRAVADLQGLMQLEVDEEMGASPATSAAPCRR